MSHEAEQAVFFIRWWQELIGGITLGMISLYFRFKGKTASAIMPISEDEIDHKMTICRQSLLLTMHDELDKRDEKFFAHVDKQNEKLLQRIKEMVRNG